jgi:hypothetical protein
MRIPGFLAFLALLFLAGCFSPPPRADLVLRGGTIVTVDEEWGEVEALAVSGDRILALGSDEEIAIYIDADTQVIDLDGKMAMPGFIEGHAHLTGMGAAQLNLNLMHVRSWDEVVKMVTEAVATARPGEWILGRGWHQEKWENAPTQAVEGFPTHHSISAVSPDNPVCLTHASGHACFFNAKAMELAEVDAETQAPLGGEILKDEDGQPIGVFRETAQNLVKRAHREKMAQRTPEEAKEDLRRVIRLADEECLRNGITSFQDAGSSLGTIDVMREMAQRGELGARLWVMVRESNERLAQNLSNYHIVEEGQGHLTVRALKRTIDGALGSRGAWLLEPYADLPHSTGLATATVKDVTETARLAREHRFQLCVHAIGDRANREVLDLFESALQHPSAKEDHRWRVEHAQHLHPDDIPRFARLGVIASMQAVHCTSDAPYVHARLGHERAEQGAYVWQKLIQSGALICNGTDAPVEDVSPIACYYSAVSRQLPDGTRFYPDQRMGRLEALKSYTIHCAKAAFEEHLKGSLSPGKYADIVVLSQNLLTVAEDQIPQTEVLYTIVGGEIKYTVDAKL